MSYFIAQSFSDFDVYNESVKTWDLEFVQLGYGQFHADLVLFGDEDLHVGRVHYNKLLLQNGSAPPAGYTFAIHNRNSAPFCWRYQDFLPHSIIVFPENRELHGVSHPGHHPFIVTISENLLAETAHLLGLPEPNTFIHKGRVCSCDPSSINEIQQLLISLCGQVEVTRGHLLDSLLNSHTKRQLTDLLLKSLANSSGIKPRKRNFKDRTDTIDKIIEFVDANLSTSITIKQLCTVAGVEERTLRNLFYEYFSLSPKKFLNSCRLNAVRNRLVQENPGHTRISYIANHYGFWHMGQFAKDYQRQFGELPSDTLTRN